MDAYDFGAWFRGRPMNWDPDHQALEQERQSWVYEHVSGLNDAVVELTIDPERQYQAHYDAFVETGDPGQLRLMLEYVR